MDNNLYLQILTPLSLKSIDKWKKKIATSLLVEEVSKTDKEAYWILRPYFVQPISCMLQ